MNKTLLSLAITAALCAFSVPSLALNAAADAVTLTIHEGAISSSLIPHTVIADQLSGQYNEILSITSPGVFNSLAYFNAGGWFNNTISQPSYVNGFPSGYKLYALFQSSGTLATSGSGSSAVTNFTGTSGTIELFADPNQDTIQSMTLPAAAGDTVNNITRTHAGDDILLGSATSLIAANGHSYFGSGANGDFELIFNNWSLTGAGASYFVGPSPFPTTVDLNGNFQSFNPASASDFILPQSSSNAFFAATVPEPASLALLGLGLIGIGLSRRRSI